MIRLLFIVLLFQFLTLNQIYAQSLSKIDSLENLLYQNPNKDTISVNLSNRMAYELSEIDIDKTLKYAKEAGELANKIKFSKGYAKSLGIIGVYYEGKSEYSHAILYYQKSLKITKKLTDKNRNPYAYNSIGGIVLRNGRLRKGS